MSSCRGCVRTGTTFPVTVTRTPSMDIKRPEREGDQSPSMSREE